MSEFHPVITLPVAASRALVYEEGWQSWSPSTCYPLTVPPFRPAAQNQQRLGYRADDPAPAGGFCGEGLLAVYDGQDTHVFATSRLDRAPQIHARPSVVTGGPSTTIEIAASGTVDHTVHTGVEPQEALAAWADGQRNDGSRPNPTVWCSWYQYFADVTEADILENLDAIGAHDLPVDVVQIDDGYQVEIGDWLIPSGRFDSVPGIADRIRAAGRRAGIWVAPFLVGARSALAAEHPEWLVPNITAGRNWEQDLFVLDSTHPGAAAYLTEVFKSFADMGFDYFKIDFIYAGALRGRRHADLHEIEAYRAGLEIIRQAIRPDSYLVGCGAPTMATRGLVDALRVSPDTAPEIEPVNGWMNEPAQRSAIMTGRGRHWQNRRLWAADPDCFLARPAVEDRERWVEHCLEYGGLRTCSDRIADLDDWGLEMTRRYLEGS